MGITPQDEKFKPIIAANVFKGVFDVIRETLSKVVIQKAAELPGVSEKIEEQKTEVAKNTLFKYIPFILIGTILIALVVRFK